jgi:hypothetical protein
MDSQRVADLICGMNTAIHALPASALTDEERERMASVSVALLWALGCKPETEEQSVAFRGLDKIADGGRRLRIALDLEGRGRKV